MATISKTCSRCHSTVSLSAGEVKVSEEKRMETVDPDGGYPYEVERTHLTTEFTCPCGCKNEQHSIKWP